MFFYVKGGEFRRVGASSVCGQREIFRHPVIEDRRCTG